MTINDLIVDGERILKSKGIISYHLDTQLLLSYILNKNKTYILSHPEEKINPKDRKKFNKLIKLRSLNKPVAQIIGYKEFYGYNFTVNSKVLIPRPESEEFIIQLGKLIKSHALNKDTLICDLGTGSGAIGISIKKQYPSLRVDLVDKYRSALKVAHKNVVGLSTQNRLIRSNLLSKTSKNYDVIVANLPYVPLEIEINSEAKQEPRTSIFSKSNGLSHYNRMFNQIDKFNKKPLYLILEYLDISRMEMISLAKRHGYSHIYGSGLVHTFKKNIVRNGTRFGHPNGRKL